MRADRRQFMKVAGLALLGLGVKQATDLVAGSNLAEASSQPVAPGKRWAMAIDLSRCVKAEGCTDCIVACHRAHNVPQFHDPKEEVKWIWKTSYESAFAEDAHPFTAAGLAGEQIPVMCNHCDNPACVRVCPTRATWKREDGIVMMDMHRCIGCRYCMVACPYGARSFNFRDPREGLDMKALPSTFPTRTRGVVEKCNFCTERLAKGQAPACMEACTEKAILFGDLLDPRSAIREALNTRHSIRRNPGAGTSPQIYYLV